MSPQGVISTSTIAMSSHEPDFLAPLLRSSTPRMEGIISSQTLSVETFVDDIRWRWSSTEKTVDDPFDGSDESGVAGVLIASNRLDVWVVVDRLKFGSSFVESQCLTEEAN